MVFTYFIFELLYHPCKNGSELYHKCLLLNSKQMCNLQSLWLLKRHFRCIYRNLIVISLKIMTLKNYRNILRKRNQAWMWRFCEQINYIYCYIYWLFSFVCQAEIRRSTRYGYSKIDYINSCGYNRKMSCFPLKSVKQVCYMQ